MHTLSTRWLCAGVAVASAVLVAACGGPTDVDDVQLGSDVAVVTTDGSRVEGTLVGVSDEDVVVQRANTGQRDTIARAGIASVEETGTSDRAALGSPAPTAQDVTLPGGTILPAALDVALGSETNRVEDPVTATVRSPLIAEGLEAIPAGATLRGHVTHARPSGDVKGRATLAFRFESLTIDHHDYDIDTNALAYHASATKKEDAATIGGGGAGTAVVLTTPGGEIHLAPGAELVVELAGPLIVSVPLE